MHWLTNCSLCVHVCVIAWGLLSGSQFDLRKGFTVTAEFTTWRQFHIFVSFISPAITFFSLSLFQSPRLSASFSASDPISLVLSFSNDVLWGWSIYSVSSWILAEDNAIIYLALCSISIIYCKSPIKHFNLCVDWCLCENIHVWVCVDHIIDSKNSISALDRYSQFFCWCLLSENKAMAIINAGHKIKKSMEERKKECPGSLTQKSSSGLTPTSLKTAKNRHRHPWSFPDQVLSATMWNSVNSIFLEERKQDVSLDDWWANIKKILLLQILFSPLPAVCILHFAMLWLPTYTGRRVPVSSSAPHGASWQQLARRNQWLRNDEKTFECWNKVQYDLWVNLSKKLI